MSQSNLIKSLLVLGLALILPESAEALTLKYKNQSFEVSPKYTKVEKAEVRNDFDLKSTALRQVLGKSMPSEGTGIDAGTIKTIFEAEAKLNRANQSAELIIENDRAIKFQPSQEGQTLDTYSLLTMIVGKSSEIAMPVLVSTPKVQLGELNDLGIKELVAIGESDFTGSSKNRVTNVSVGASRFNGVIIKPGEEFSFNKFLGEVDGAHGFVPEIVIKREGLVPEYGGGLCQVSSTAFRAAMNGGFKITQRKNHSFAVRYYTPAGSDATIYAPTLDMKFINDLESHILIRTKIEGTKLYFEYYGTKDDRLVELDGPHQYDKKPDGSLKAVWTKRVTKNGQTTEQVFRSTYVSPNLYQKVATTEAKPTPPAENPTPTPTPVPVPAEQ